MRQIHWSVLLVLVPLPAAAFRPADTAGLALAIEEIREPVQLNGMSVQIQLARGIDVPALVERIARRWRAGGEPVLPLAHGDWSMLSHWEGPLAQLLQWRGSGESAELIWSSLEVTQARIAPAPRIPAPNGCIWGGNLRIPGPQGDFFQRTARCTGNRRAARAWLVDSFRSDGWAVTAAGTDMLRLMRPGTQAHLVIGNDTSRSGYWLVWTEQKLPAGGDQ